MKKKVLFIIPSLRGGGAEKNLVDVFRNLDYMRYEVDLLLLCEQGVFYERIPGQVRVLSLFGKTCSVFFRLLSLVCRRLHLRATIVYRLYSIGLREYDIVVSFMEGNALLFHSLMLHKGRLNISWVHTDFVNGYWTASLFKSGAEELSCYQQMDKIVCVSHATKKMFRTRYDIPDEKVEVICNLIDKQDIIRKSTSFEVTKNRFTICFVAGLPKQADRLVRVARLFKDNGYALDFWFVGDNGIRENMEAMSRELQVNDNCRFWGFQKNPYPYLKASDLYVSTSSTDSFSLSIAEALCLGIPVVAAKTAGSCELLNNNLYGLLTDHTDESIYENLKCLVDEPELLHHYHMQAIRRSEKFDVDKTMNEIYNLFEKNRNK